MFNKHHKIKVYKMGLLTSLELNKIEITTRDGIVPYNEEPYLVR